MEQPQTRRAHMHSYLRAGAAPGTLLIGLLAGLLQFGAAAAAHADGPAVPAPGASEDELRSVWARGLPEDRLFELRSLYLADGIAVEAFAGGGWLLNPPPGLSDAGIPFRNVLFNSAGLFPIVDQRGAGLVRLSTYIPAVDVDLRPKGAGPSFGHVHIHGIDLRGTLVRVVRTR